MAGIPEHEDKLGDVLLQVQQDLRLLKCNIEKINANDKCATLDIQALDNAIGRTQSSIRKHAEDYLKAVNTQQLVLPTIEDLPKQTVKTHKWKPSLESLPDVHSQRKTFHGALPIGKVKHPRNISGPVEILQDTEAKGKRFLNLPDDDLEPAVQASLLCMSVQHKIMSLNPRKNLYTSKRESDSISDKESKWQMDSESSCVRKPREGHPVWTSSSTHSKASESMDQWDMQATTSFITKGSQKRSVEVSVSTTKYPFTIMKGQIDPMERDFSHFKHSFSVCWSSVVDALEALNKLLRDFAVPLAKVNGERLVELCLKSDCGWRKTPSAAVLFSVLENQEEVLGLVSRPGQRYRGERGTETAAICIQSCWRRYLARTAYMCHCRRRWAVQVISLSWAMHAQRCHVKRALQARRFSQLENYRSRAQHLAANWKHIRSSKRTIIHIPSLGYSKRQRLNTRRYDILQNIQISRLCDVRDENVEVIYICPMHLGEDILQCYTSLQKCNGADSRTSQASSCNRRFIILTPEAVDHFPTHNMCLSTLLKYSPRTLKRIKHLIQGKQAYIVGRVGHLDDLAVADELDVPILGPEPAVSQLHSTKSGGRRIFSVAGVDVPPGQGDVYSLDQRWLFKINLQRGGCDTAFCDVCHLSCYNWALQRYRRYGPDLWSSKWVQESVLPRYLDDIPEWLAHYAQPAKTSSFLNWSSFLKTFLRQGGVVEAHPPSASVTYLTVDILLEPSGEVTMLSCGDQLHGSCFPDAVGSTVPQTSVHPETLHSICMRVAQACQQHFVGYISVGLATFVDHSTMEQKVWAFNLDIVYSDQLAMTQMLLMTTGGTLNWHTGCLEVPVKGKCFEQQAAAEHPVVTRYAVIGIHLFHSNLSMLYHNVFLKVCKVHGIEFNKKQKQGTVFALYDTSERCSIGMITISEDLQGALVTFAQNLSVIHQEISSSKKQGETNFKELIRTVEDVLQMIIQNKNQLKDKPAA
ncbi:IQ motif-containing protein H isoform X2 [Girardinichthys multiradiatus]|uniref:IQ motif-containing protein H isoform X2 n=1 Tax=Girardinichthys multiradiatus TaxID=208333 RepID=UPI001FAD702D|nr:IQ motif-containing protein H isoform X2 [Girardinichthys multiradiatus]